MKFTRNPFVSALALSLVFFSSSHAGTIWDGGGNNTDIDTKQNWDGNGGGVANALNGTTAAVFATGGTAAVINVNASFTGVTINSAAAFGITNGAGSLTIGSGGITVTLPSTTGLTHTISESNLILGANQNWSVTNNTGIAQLNVSSLISGSGVGINKTGSGILQLSGANTYTGTTDVQAGTLALGASDVFANTSTLQISGGILAMGNFSDSVGAVSLTSGSITGSGGTLTGSSYAVQSGSVSAKLGGALIGLTKTTAGTVSLSAANTYTGATTINAGTLELLAGGSLASSSIVVGDVGSTAAILDAITSGLIVASGQTVSGIGTIKGSTTIQSGGAISPGNSPGILTNLGNISLDPNSTFQAEINGTIAGTSYDQLNVTGASSIVTLGGLLSVTTTGAQTNGNLFFLIDNDGSSAISGAFSNAPINGNTYTFGSQQYAISYFGNYTGNALTDSFIGGNDVVLMAVPEPSAALLGGIGVLCLLRRRRG